MAIVRTNLAFIGTDESTLQTVVNNATQTGAEVDVLGSDSADGDIELYAVITSTVTVGTIDIKVNSRRVTGQAYSKPNFEISVAPTNGTQKIPLGRRPASRYMNVEAKNNATGASASVSILATLIKLT